MPYKVKGKCVYKKEDNSKVGCTKGGKSDKLSIKDIADKFKVSVDKIESQIKKGIGVEVEHTNDKIKTKYCVDNKIKLKIIKYDEDIIDKLNNLF